MDQLKDILKQAAKHRFWIAVGIAALLPLIAFFVGTGSLAEAEVTATKKIKDAKSEANNFIGKPIENNQWKDAVEEKKSLVAIDVAKSHKKLYDLQAPFLTWPPIVAEDFQAWGEEKYPEVDIQKMDDRILDYTQAYDEYVETVYQAFVPFNLATGEGIVAAPSKQALMRPVAFNELNRPSLSDVWAAQRKLWIERTMFDVIAKVNKKVKAKNWDEAAIKQIVMLEVANGFALDQKTAAKPDELQLAPPIPGDPKAAAPSADAAKTTTGSSRSADAGGFGNMGGGGAATGPSAPDTIEFVKSTNPTQFYIVPVALSVYIEQDRIPDLLVEFRNSPMSIRILDFQMRKPSTPVKKPKKGETSSSFAGSMEGGRGRTMGGLAGGMGDDSGSAQTIDTSSMQNNNKGYNDRAKNSRSMGQGGMDGAPKTKTREGGKDTIAENVKKIEEKRRNKNNPDKDKDKDKAKADEDESTLSNPYFNVVQVTIRGQARFYKAPPKGVEPATSPGATTPEAPKDAPKVDAPKADAAKIDAPKDAAKTEVPKADAAKADMPKDAAKADAPKADAAKPETPKADAPKADAPKADAAKPEAPKTDAPNTEAPKVEPPKTDAPKTEPPKADGEKPKS